MDLLSDNNKKSIKYYTFRYIQEIIEAFIAYSIYVFIKTKSIDIYNNIQIALVIGIITLLLEEYNPTYNKAVKTGLIMTSVSNAFKS